jgi:hypothetical protein
MATAPRPEPPGSSSRASWRPRASRFHGWTMPELDGVVAFDDNALAIRQSA